MAKKIVKPNHPVGVQAKRAEAPKIVVPASEALKDNILAHADTAPVADPVEPEDSVIVMSKDENFRLRKHKGRFHTERSGFGPMRTKADRVWRTIGDHETRAMGLKFFNFISGEDHK